MWQSRCRLGEGCAWAICDLADPAICPGATNVGDILERKSTMLATCPPSEVSLSDGVSHLSCLWCVRGCQAACTGTTAAVLPLGESPHHRSTRLKPTGAEYIALKWTGLDGGGEIVPVKVMERMFVYADSGLWIILF